MKFETGLRRLVRECVGVGVWQGEPMVRDAGGVDDVGFVDDVA